MKTICLFLLTTIVCLLLPLSKAKADQWSDALASYTNPHAICQYYRSQSSITINRESDSECLVSAGQGQYVAYTQYYYSGNNWCVRVIQGGKTLMTNCIPVGNSSQNSSPKTIPSHESQAQSKSTQDTREDWWHKALEKGKPGGSFKNDIFNPYWYLVVPTTFVNDIFDPIWRVKVASHFRDDLFNRSWWWLNYTRPIFKFSSPAKTK